MTVQKFWDYTDAITSAMVTQLFTGEAPDESQIESHISFVNAQQNYAASVGIADPVVYGFEALASAFASGNYEGDSRFAQLVAGRDGSSAADTIFVVQMYNEIFDASPTQAQAQHFFNQVNYFQNLYQSNGIADWAVRGYGAAAGQMLGASLRIDSPLADYYQAGHAFVVDALDSNSSNVPFDQNMITFYGIS